MPIIRNTIIETVIKTEPKDMGPLKQVKNDMAIISIKKLSKDKDKFAIIRANMLTTYLKEENKPMAQFRVGEELLFSGTKKDVKELIKEWEANKKLPKDNEDSILNGIKIRLMYDVHFFTNRLGFPPASGFDLKVRKNK